MDYRLQDLSELRDFYKDRLLNNTLSFWFPRSVDTEHGGFLLMRDRDGSLLDDDKAVWIQCRFTWLLSTLYTTVEKKPEWLAAAKAGIDFIRNKCFDTDGRMFFHVTRDGRPIRKRRYYFSETFAVMAYSAYAHAANDSEMAEEARLLYGKCLHYATHPELFEPKFTDTRPMKSFGVPMMMICISQQMRDSIGDEKCTQIIDQYIGEMRDYFVKDEIACVMESVGPNGEIEDHLDGRVLNPGHAIEGAWFILREALHRNNDPELTELGCRMLDYMWARGWDEEYGGIIYFRDVYNKPVHEYWQDMKFWWPQNETIIATLMAYLMTGNAKYAEMHRSIHSYAYKNFPDEEHGEWFGYLHRDARVSVMLKGNLYKGPFHLPRQEWYCWQLLDQAVKAGGHLMSVMSSAQ